MDVLAAVPEQSWWSSGVEATEDTIKEIWWLRLETAAVFIDSGAGSRNRPDTTASGTLCIAVNKPKWLP